MASNRHTLLLLCAAFVVLVIMMLKSSTDVLREIKQVKEILVRVNPELTPQQEFQRLWDYVYTMQYNCTHGEYLGGVANGDGAYWLCSEARFWPKGSDPNYKCLVYSFGVGGDFSFDDEMARKGCEVHSFDPTENLQDGLVRESGVIFHKWGIDKVDYDVLADGSKMRTLKTMMKELGHNGRYLDYLKMDTESYEEGLMQHIIDNDLAKCIRHYAQEIHLDGPILQWPPLQKCRRLFSAMSELSNQGWRLFNTTDNCRDTSYSDPHICQELRKDNIIGEFESVLWETMFVNLNVMGPCNVQ